MCRPGREDALGRTKRLPKKGGQNGRTWAPAVGAKAAAPWVAKTRSRQLHAAEKLPGRGRAEKLRDFQSQLHINPEGLSAASYCSALRSWRGTGQRSSYEGASVTEFRLWTFIYVVAACVMGGIGLHQLLQIFLQ
jgi:hypothetical protein